MTEKDAQIGRAIAHLRGDMSQQEVATLMRQRGWKWSQATVWSVEKGERPLRLAEAEDLAEILHVLVYDFTSGDRMVYLKSAAKGMAESNNRLQEAIRAYLHAQVFLEDALARARSEGVTIDMYEAWMKESPESVIADVRFDMEHENLASEARVARYRGEDVRDRLRAQEGGENGEHPEEA